MRRPPDLAEARVFHDADMLDFLGAVGMVRLLAISGVEDWIPEPRAAVRVARQFAEELPGKLVLDAARRVAERRVAETYAFLGALDLETESLTLL